MRKRNCLLVILVVIAGIALSFAIPVFVYFRTPGTRYSFTTVYGDEFTVTENEINPISRLTEFNLYSGKDTIRSLITSQLYRNEGDAPKVKLQSIANTDQYTYYLLPELGGGDTPTIFILKNKQENHFASLSEDVIHRYPTEIDNRWIPVAQYLCKPGEWELFSLLADRLLYLGDKGTAERVRRYADGQFTGDELRSFAGSGITKEKIQKLSRKLSKEYLPGNRMKW